MAQQQVIERKTRQQWAAVINADWRKSIESIIQTGRDLINAKNDLPNGQFGKMIVEDLDFTPRTAQRIMKAVSHPMIADATPASHLPKSWAILFELSNLSTEEFKWAQDRGLINEKTSRRGARALTSALHADNSDAPVITRSNLPPPAEAKAIAKETGRIVAASDGNMYTGASDEEVAAYKDHRDAVFAIADAIKLINEQSDPETWWGQMRFWWKADFSPGDTKAAANWLRSLFYLLRDQNDE